jgi:DNA-binding helix-hairpin-helix protein with protein kinase domain
VRCALIGGGEIVAREKLGEGGEGVVYAAEDGASAVKLYHKPVAGSAAKKLHAMVKRDIGALAGQAAWPTALVSGPQGSVAGFVMPRASEAFDIHAVYSPRDRREKLPKADWRFLVHVAGNLAAAVLAAHQAGLVIGDMNHGSVRVGQNGCVRLIDCDSFQIVHDGAVLRCLVGVDSYTPPELQGARLADIDRTADHDRFGLAVLIFQLLFMGRHPFSGVPKTTGAPTDIPSAIAGLHYAYGQGKSSLRPPPSAPPIGLVTPDLAALFQQAFTQERRPTAEDWHRSLAAFAVTLAACGKNPRHAKPAHLSECPWCAFDQAGVDYFPAPMAAMAPIDLDRFDEAAFEAAWRRLDQAQQQVNGLISQPGSGSGGLPAGVQHQLEKARRRGIRPSTRYRVTGWLRRAAGVGVAAAAGWLLATETLGDAVAALGVGAGLLAISGAVTERPRQALAAALRALQRQCHIRNAELMQLAERLEGWDQADERRQRGEMLLRQIRAIRKRLTDAPRELQLNAFLGRFPLAKGCAPGIGDARVAQLASFGIESAADVDIDSICAVPGFGPHLANGLMSWRRNLATRFRFNAAQAVAPGDLRRMQAELKKPLAEWRKEIEDMLRFAQAAERNCQTAMHRAAGHEGVLKARIADVVQSEADLAALKLWPWAA